MMQSHDLEPVRCVSCGIELDATTGIDDDLRPEPGDISLCYHCGHIRAFADDLSLRDLTGQEMHAIAGDRKLLAVQRAIAEARKTRS